MMNRIFVLGSVNLDLVVYSQEFPEIGETILGEDFFINLGGKGANQAVAAHKAGGKVKFIGRIGKDYFGAQVMNELKKGGVEKEIYIDKSIPTGTAIINVNIEGDNKITVIPGANEKLGETELIFLKSNIVKGDILLLQGEMPFNTLIEAVKHSSSIGASVIFDPSPFRESLKKIIPFVNFLTPNQTELSKLTLTGNANELFNYFGVPVILKLGKGGIHYKDKWEDFFIPAFKVDVVDTTGAGDIFNGTFAVAMSEGKTIREALIFASAASAISVTRKGAAISSPRRDEIETFLWKMNL
jgi:ribokinase